MLRKIFNESVQIVLFVFSKKAAIFYYWVHLTIFVKKLL
jgi:hypothetical protein